MRAYDISDDSLDFPDVAVVGMAVRLPGALDVHDYWRNLQSGVESIRRLSEEELKAAGVDSALLHDPNYVRAAAILDRLEQFDASFFGFSKREASVLDPQHRHFLEVCFEALESAGVVPEAFQGAIGVFGGSGMNAYMPYNLFTNPELMASMGLFLVRHTGNDKDFLTTRVSYCLNLTGPALNVQTACSTSLVAIHLACQSLLAGECDAALAGGVTIELPHYRGYRYEEGEILSPDGHCRPFEARSKGTVFGSGAGAVVLKRLRDAVENGDHIHAIIKGSAINNDGDRKVGYLAPSVAGQAECIVEALQVADLSARDVSYVECHGTGTPVGDPIEVAALTQAFGRSTTDKQFCGIGSVKSNIGHLDTAAGVASFVKVVQMLEKEELVPTLHFEKPNPQIDFSSTPFFVLDHNRAWPRGDRARRAGVSSLGVGGTNAHVIVEEPPRRAKREQRADYELLFLSARSQASLDAASARLARHLEEHPDIALSDVSSTLLRGRRRFPFRRVLSAETTAQARELLAKPDPLQVFDVRRPGTDVPVIFMFPGGGAQHANMARDVYEREPEFKRALDECLALLKSRSNVELFQLLFPPAGQEEAASRELQRPSLALPALLSIEIAFAKLLESWGIRPVAMIGHSLGEYAAAYLASVLSLEAALGIMCCRGRLFETVKPGGMLSVPMDPKDLEPLLDDRLSIAAVNAPGMSVVSGDNASLAELEQVLAKRDVEARRLHIDVPAHSPLLDPILNEFAAYLEGVRLGTPARPYVSNLTGTFVEPSDISRGYFVRHLRNTVRFADGLATLFERHPEAVLIEVGPGQTLSSLTRLHSAKRAEHAIVPLSPHVKDTTSPARFLRTSVGRALAHGAAVDVEAFLRRRPRRIVPLPPTPFEHERHWIEPGKGYFMSSSAAQNGAREEDVGRWFFRTAFREEPRAPRDVAPKELWIVLAEGPLAASIVLEARAMGVRPVLISPGAKTERLGSDHFALKLSDPQGYDDTLQAIFAEHKTPRRVLHALALSPDALDPAAAPEAHVLDRCFYSLLHLAQVLGQEELDGGVELLVATSRAYDVANTTTLRPLHALTQGPVLVIPREIPEIRARGFDVLDASSSEATARALLAELSSPSTQQLIAERAGVRYCGILERAVLGEGAPLALPEKPVVLITGGLGGIARSLSRHFASTRGAKIVLVSRTKLPAREKWADERKDLDPRSLRAEQLDDLLALEALGTELDIERADVTVESEVRALVERVRRRFGSIDVVIHAAGVLDDGPLALKDRLSTRAVIAPKLDGAQNLANSLQDTPPAAFFLLSSTSAVLGPPGQIDYVAANAAVAATARSLSARWSNTRVVSLGYGVWRDTGMAARTLRPFAPSLSGEPTAHPLVQRKQPREDGGVEFESLYDPARLWVLDEHRVRGQSAVLPGTAIVELVRAAGALALGLGKHQAIALSDVLFITPVEVPDGEPRLARVVVTRESPEQQQVQVVLASRGRDDKSDVEHARGAVARLDGAAPERLPIAQVEARCNARTTEFEEGAQVLPQDLHLAFGPRWRVLRSMRFGAGEAVARLALPKQFERDLDTFFLHPGLLDILSGFAFSLADPSEKSDRVRVPLSYQHLRSYAPLERELVSHARLRPAGADDTIAVFDVTVATPEGRVLLEIEGYTTKAVPPASLQRAPRAAKEPSLLERWSKQGITASEGAEVVERLLQSAAPPELYASPTSLYEMLEELEVKRQAEAREDAQGPASGTRTAADGAPRDDLERRLAEMWRALLGVDNIGIRDNFFELGGHSLIAVRLFGRIKKAYGVDLPLAVLFQAPTIEACAEVLRKELGITFSAEPEKSNGSSPRAATSQERSFSNLVAIQRGNGKSVPFFCVHGAGGNILNFRDLSQHLGRDQTFYGLQARGVSGEAPAATIEEMAEAYLQEMRAAWPDGPYLLGGYSGGGVVAYEIAQRLAAEGRKVPLLVFLDTFHPHTAPRKLTMKDRVARLLDEGPGYLSRQGKAKLSRHLDELSTDLKLMFLTANDLPLPLELRELQITRAFINAASRYKPRPYRDPVLLFRARLMDEIYRHMGPTLGWKDLVNNLEIVEVPGGHDSLVLEPNVQVLASHLSRAIVRATQS